MALATFEGSTNVAGLTSASYTYSFLGTPTWIFALR